MNSKRNPIDALLDPNDNAPITLYDENDNGIEFKQICLVPIKNQIYCILKPVKPLEGLGANEGLVFQIYTDKEREDTLLLITDEKIISDVFDIYDDLYNKA